MISEERLDEIITDSITKAGQDIRGDLIMTLCEWVSDYSEKYDKAAKAVDDYIARHKDEILKMSLPPDSDLKEYAKKAKPLQVTN